MRMLDLRLPNLTEGDTDAQLRQLRSFLFQLTEQLQLAFAGEEQTRDVPDRQALLREALALTGKQFAARSAEFLEAPWQRQNGALEQLRQAVAALEDGFTKTPEAPTAAVGLADMPGVQIQRGETVRFTPLLPFTPTADGHWLLE